MSEERELKRIRQACQSCRRKKTRCSGERPACSFCVRLGNPCNYSIGVHQPQGWIQDMDEGGQAYRDAGLAARVALLESRLGLAGANANALTYPQGAVASQVNLRGQDIAGTTERNDLSSAHVASDIVIGQRNFSVVPPHSILESLTDVYFSCCQNQPYCYFQERAFRQRLREGEFPDYLLLAFAATAARFSTHDYFQNRQKDATEEFARAAWLIILGQVFSSEHGLNLFGVQATNLLAVIDFTAGHNRLGWLKIGLAIRFAQSLKLTSEPDLAMPVWEQEERRRVFWSVYLLDRFVSCGRTRPPTILDMDCTVRLPTTDDMFRAGLGSETPTLALLKELPNVAPAEQLGHFALLVLSASTLGRVARYSLQRSTSKAYPPWDFRSDFAKIQTILASLENIVTSSGKDVEESIDNLLQISETQYRPLVGHFVWSIGLYHLSSCLLYHPFTLFKDLHRYYPNLPCSFATDVLHRCRRHAGQLSKLLQIVGSKDCCMRGSYLGYFGVVAGSIHKLFEHSANPEYRKEAMLSFRECINYLEQWPVYWDNYRGMATALRDCTISPSTAQALLQPSTTPKEPDPGELERSRLLCILDYSWLSDRKRRNDQMPLSVSSLDSSTLDCFDGIFGNETSLGSGDTVDWNLFNSII